MPHQHPLARAQERQPSFSPVSDEYSDTEKPARSHTLETTAVRPLDKRTLYDSDDWPSFVLEDATVLHKNGQIANLLNAELRGPFVVVGKLVVDEDNACHLTKKRYANQYIEIRQCFKYSIGNPATIWVEGQGGWYEISPSPRYRDMFRHMLEAIRMFFFIVELYESALTRRSRIPHLPEIFYKYALYDGTGLQVDGAKATSVQGRLAEHSEFFISHMRQEQVIYSQNRDAHKRWLDTTFYSWNVKVNPIIANDFMRYDERNAAADLGTTRAHQRAMNTLKSEAERQQMPTSPPGRATSGKRPYASIEGLDLDSPKTNLMDHSMTTNLITTPDVKHAEAPKSLPPKAEEEEQDIKTIPQAPTMDDSATDSDDYAGPKKSMSAQNKKMSWRPHKTDQRPRDTRIICGIIAQESKNTYNLSKLGNHLYYRWSIAIPAMGQAIIRICAAGILENLDASWSSTALYRDLKKAVAGQLGEMTEQDDLLYSIVPEFRLRKRVSKKTEDGGSTTKSQVPTRRPIQSKPESASADERKSSAVATSSGRNRLRSGKAPGLRPPTALKRKSEPKQSLLDMTADEEDELVEESAQHSVRPPSPTPVPVMAPTRKRRRAFSPSLAERTPPPAGRPRPDLTCWNGEPDLSSVESTPEPDVPLQADQTIPIRSLNSTSAKDKAKTKTILSIAIKPPPGISSHTTGPYHTFHCPQPKCTFNIVDARADDEEARATIRQHLRVHAAELERAERDIARELFLRRRTTGAGSRSGDDVGVGDEGQGPDIDVAAVYLLERIERIGRRIREREQQLLGSNASGSNQGQGAMAGVGSGDGTRGPAALVGSVGSARRHGGGRAVARIKRAGMV